MAKIRREEAVNVALDLLNEAGLDGVTTRRVAQRLGVESASLYWHFKSKTDLLNEMASVILGKHEGEAIPTSPEQWKVWLAGNSKSFREALLAYRDGARLHAGTIPNSDQIKRIALKVDYLVSARFSPSEAAMALYSISQFTLGCVFEEQTSLSLPEVERHATPTKGLSQTASRLVASVKKPTGLAAFEFGLRLLIEGLERGLEQKPPKSTPGPRSLTKKRKTQR